MRPTYLSRSEETLSFTKRIQTGGMGWGSHRGNRPSTYTKPNDRLPASSAALDRTHVDWLEKEFS